MARFVSVSVDVSRIVFMCAKCFQPAHLDTSHGVSEYAENGIVYCNIICDECYKGISPPQTLEDYKSVIRHFVEMVACVRE